MLLDWIRIKRFVEKELPVGPGTVCVDLDSVLLYHKSEWGDERIGRVLPFGLQLCQLLRGRGKNVVVLTARPREQHQKLYDYLRMNRFPIDRITNEKPFAQAYFDDKAVRIPKNWK